MGTSEDVACEEYFTLPSDIACPFCGEKDFDDIGLKNHLNNWCEKYEAVEEV